MSTQRKIDGVGEYRDHLGNVTEVYAVTCAHCQHIVEFPSRRQMMEHVEFCRGCGKLVGIECGCAGGPCNPWERELDKQEKEANLTKEQIEEAEHKINARLALLKDMGLL